MSYYSNTTMDSGTLDEGLSSPAIAVTGLSLLAGLYIIYTTFLQPAFSEKGRFWRTQSWVGVRKELFANMKAQGRTVTGMHTMLREGYEKYSKKGQAFAVPFFANEPFVILPPSKAKDLAAWPHTKVDAEPMHNESLQSHYTIGDDISGYKAYHMDVVRRQLTRKLPLMTADIAEELELGFKDQWGTSEEWTKAKLYPSCMRLVSRAANRVFGGAELCRNPAFLENSKLYSQGVFRDGVLIRMWPRWLRPLVAPIIVRQNNKILEEALKHAVPVVTKRLANTQKKTEDPSFDWTPPNDALQWLIEECIATQDDPAELRPRMLSRRLLALNMVAIHTTSMGITNTLLDIYSSPDSAAIVEGLREESSRALAAHNGVWTKDAINSLHRHDSAIRESMRYSPMGELGLSRLVVAPSGVDFGDGIVIPAGVQVATHNHGIHHDATFYGADAHTYKPFRFSAPREVYEENLASARAQGKSESDIRKVLELKNQALITVGPNFLSFGNGLHACPGRFFASQEMKLMLVLVTRLYEVQPWAARPENMHRLMGHMPTEETDIVMRRRK